MINLMSLYVNSLLWVLSHLQTLLGQVIYGCVITQRGGLTLRVPGLSHNKTGFGFKPKSVSIPSRDHPFI